MTDTAELRALDACYYHATKAFWGRWDQDQGWLPPWDALVEEYRRIASQDAKNLDEIVALSERMVKSGGSRKEHARLLRAIGRA